MPRIIGSCVGILQITLSGPEPPVYVTPSLPTSPIKPTPAPILCGVSEATVVEASMAPLARSDCVIQSVVILATVVGKRLIDFLLLQDCSCVQVTTVVG